jgi:hypothetical protein
MSKLINEDWEHAAYANDKMYEGERNYRMELEWQEWEHEQQKKSKQPAVIIVEKPIKDENAHNSSSVQRTHQKGL